MLSLETSLQENIRRVVLAGELDMESAVALEEAALPGMENELILDFSGVTFVDSTGMYRLLQINQAWLEKGRQVRIVNLPPEIAEVFHLVGLTEVMGNRCK